MASRVSARAFLAVGVIIGTAFLQDLLFLGDPSFLLATDYGRLVLAKGAGFTLLVVETIAGPFRARAHAYALLIAVPLAIAYLAESIGIHWITYRSLRFSPADNQGLALFGVSCALAFLALGALYRAIANRGARLSTSTIGLALSGIAAAGALVFVVRTPAALPEADNGPLERLPAAADEVPLLFVGLDGGSWRLLAPAIEKIGRAHV